jgi:hypothetical protein
VRRPVQLSIRSTRALCPTTIQDSACLGHALSTPYSHRSYILATPISLCTLTTYTSNSHSVCPVATPQQPTYCHLRGRPRSHTVTPLPLPLPLPCLTATATATAMMPGKTWDRLPLYASDVGLASSLWVVSHLREQAKYLRYEYLHCHCHCLCHCRCHCHCHCHCCSHIVPHSYTYIVNLCINTHSVCPVHSQTSYYTVPFSIISLMLI